MRTHLYSKSYPEHWFTADYKAKFEDDYMSGFAFTLRKIDALDETGNDHDHDNRATATGTVKFDGDMRLEFDGELYLGGPEWLNQLHGCLQEVYNEARKGYGDTYF